MFVRNYIIRVGFLLTILELALAVYLLIQGIGDGEFYDKLFFYSVFLSLIPIILGIIIFSFYDQGNTYLEQANGFVSTNLKKSKTSQYNDTPMYLIALGLVFLVYNLVFRLLSLPNWIIILLPFILAVLIFIKGRKIELINQA